MPFVQHTEATGATAGATHRRLLLSTLTIAALSVSVNALAAGSATFSITPDGDLAASSTDFSAFVIENTSTGNEKIETVVIDLSTTLLPDLIFDPAGSAGDSLSKPLTPNQGLLATGYVVTADPASDPFSQPANGVDGTDGYHVVTLEFTDFDPGETFTFSVDVDPASLKNAPVISSASFISGIEMTGTTVQVDFDDLSVATGHTFRVPGTDGGSTVNVNGSGPSAPALSVPGVSLAPTSLSPDHSAAVVPGGDSVQTIRVSGPVGGAVRLVQMEAALLADLGFELELFESNLAQAVTEYAGVIGPGGTLDIPVTLTRGDPINGGFNHFAAVVEINGERSPNSNYVILELDSGVPNQPPIVGDESRGLGLGETVVINVLDNDSDPDGTLDAASLTVIDGPTSGTLVPGIRGAFTYTHDGVAEVTDGFTYTVSDNDGATSSVATVELFVTSLTDLPPDVDDDGVDNAADNDDDNDGFLDTEDPFALDADNGTTGDLPLSLPLYRTNPGTGLFGIGFTGLMTNGVIGGAQGDDYQALYDTDKLLVDANADNGSVYTLINVDEGDAFEGDNTQTHAFQVGLNVDTLSEPFVVRGRILAPYFDGVPPDFFQSTGIYIGTGDQDNYLKIVLDGQADSAEVLIEVDGDAPAGINRGPEVLASESADLYLLVDPATLSAQAQLSVDGAPLVPIGPPVSLPAAWLDPNDAFGLAMGLIQTSSGPGPTFDANYDLLEAYFLATDDALLRFEGASTEPVDVLANDHVDPALTIVAAGTPNRGGSAVVNDNGTPSDPSDDFIDYTPRGGYVGEETFTYTVRDSNGVEGTALVTITLLPAAIFSDGFENQ